MIDEDDRPIGSSAVTSRQAAEDCTSERVPLSSANRDLILVESNS